MKKYNCPICNNPLTEKDMKIGICPYCYNTINMKEIE